MHPFLDGNGRMGRMIVPLFLFEMKLLHTPMFYVSEFLERHRQEYYDRLLAVSRDDDWTGWCQFFLRALTEQASSNETKTRGILNLYETRKKWLVETTLSRHAISTLDFLFSNPIFRTNRFIEETAIPKGSANRILNTISDKGLLKMIEKGSGKRASLFVFLELLNLTEGKEAFFLSSTGETLDP